MPETGPVSDSVAAKGGAPSVAQTGEAASAASPKTKAAEPSHGAQSASPVVEASSSAAGELGPADPPGGANAGADAESVGTGIEVDSAYDGDSAIGDDVSGYSTSVASSVMANQYEHGRRYQAYKDSTYIRPNDEPELDRLDLMHHIFKTLSHGKLFEAPIPKNVQRVLDLGCGTGIWAIDFADEFPSAEVLGVDISPIQPAFTPPNLKFEIDDIEEDFTYHRKFDYIHVRYLAYSIKDWPRLVKQIYEHLAPGGFVEFFDYDLTYRSPDSSLEGTTLKAWGDDLPRAGRMIGREGCPGLYLEDWIRDAGFININHKVYKLPIGPWPANKHLKMLGAYNHVMVYGGVESFTLRLFINVLKWTYEEVQVLLAQVRKDLNNKSIHAYNDMHKLWAQKPGGEEETAA